LNAAAVAAVNPAIADAVMNQPAAPSSASPPSTVSAAINMPSQSLPRCSAKK
jgi:hypothetical protein